MTFKEVKNELAAGSPGIRFLAAAHWTVRTEVVLYSFGRDLVFAKHASSDSEMHASITLPSVKYYILLLLHDETSQYLRYLSSLALRIF